MIRCAALISVVLAGIVSCHGVPAGPPSFATAKLAFKDIERLARSGASPVQMLGRTLEERLPSGDGLIDEPSHDTWCLPAWEAAFEWFRLDAACKLVRRRETEDGLCFYLLRRVGSRAVAGVAAIRVVRDPRGLGDPTGWRPR